MFCRLKAILAKYTLNSAAKKDITNAINYLTTALTYFSGDGNHLVTSKGLSFYDKVTSAVNLIYAYNSSTVYGGNINNALTYLITGSYRLAVLVRDEAVKAGPNPLITNWAELLKNANMELGKAILDSKQDNYVYIFNHLTNAWKFAMNMLGAKLKKDAFGNDPVNGIPTEYGLSQNYPNPFNPTTKFDFQLPEAGHVTLRIYGVLGNLVATLVDEQKDAGFYSYSWNAAGFSSGVYFYRFNSGNYVSTKNLILLK